MNDLTRKFIFSDRNFFIFCLFFSVLMPTFNNIYDSLGVALVNFPIIAFCLFFLFKKRMILKFSSQRSLKVFFIFSFIIFSFYIWLPLSSIIGYTFGGVKPSLRDLFEVYRPLLYFSSFAIGFYAFKTIIEAEIRIKNIYLVYFFIIVAIGAIQFFRVSDIFSSLYTKIDNINSFRVAAPFPNPYDFAFIMSFFIIYFVNCFIHIKKSYAVLVVLSFALFLLPQSRSVAAGFMVGFFSIMPLVYLVLLVLEDKLSKNVLLYFIIYLSMLLVFLISIPVLIEEFPYLTGQFVKFFESGSIGNSATIRYEQFLFALEKSENLLIFLFGNGPAKNEMEYVESIYNYFFYRYGVIGFILYFVIPLSMLFYMSLKSLLRIKNKGYLYSFTLTTLLWSLTIPFMVIGNNFTEQVRVSFFYYSLIGVITSIYIMTSLNRGNK